MTDQYFFAFTDGEEIRHISSEQAINFLLPRHYSGRVPSISEAYGLFEGGVLQAVCTFGKPASPFLCDGVCGKKYGESVYELNRLCRTEEYKGKLSHFVSYCLRDLRRFNWIIVSYSDTAMHHNGYIYQACNFLYTGQTKERTDIYSGEGKHSRHYTEEDRCGSTRQVRSAKNRYIYFCTSDKKLKREWRNSLYYPIMPYPKAENQNYILGDFIKPNLITSK